MRRLVVEVGSCNGDLALALDTVDAMAEAGAWAIKGQLYRADTIVAKGTPTYGKGLGEPATQREAFASTLTYDEWGIVKERCAMHDVLFFGSVFDLDAVRTAQEQQWPIIKIASADITYIQLLEAAAATGADIYLSTGASTESEIRQAVDWLDVPPHRLALFACTLSYPTETVDAHVGRVKTLSRLFHVKHVGYSDHTRGVAVADYAFRLGAGLVEKHVTIVPGTGGDHNFAATPEQVRSIVYGDVPSHEVGDALMHGSAVLVPHTVEHEAREHARRSLVTTRPVRAGQKFTDLNMAVLRPGTGLPPAMWDDIVGQSAAHNLPAWATIGVDDVA